MLYEVITPGEAKGMILGDTSDIDDEMLTAFRDTGIAHLLSVSGLHVSMLALAFSLLFRRNAWVRFAAVAVFCALYAAITARITSYNVCYTKLLRDGVQPLAQRKREKANEQHDAAAHHGRGKRSNCGVQRAES